MLRPQNDGFGAEPEFLLDAATCIFCASNNFLFAEVVIVLGLVMVSKTRPGICSLELCMGLSIMLAE